MALFFVLLFPGCSFLEQPFVHYNASTGFTEVEAPLNNNSVTIGWYAGIAAGTCLTMQFYQGILDVAFFEMVIF